MTDIVERLRDVGKDSLVMAVVRDCMDAAGEIEGLRKELESNKLALKTLKDQVEKMVAVTSG